MQESGPVRSFCLGKYLGSPGSHKRIKVCDWLEIGDLFSRIAIETAWKKMDKHPFRIAGRRLIISGIRQQCSRARCQTKRAVDSI